jgi:Glycosyl transferase family 2
MVLTENGLAQNTKMLRMPVRCVYEPREGKGYAYNTGLAEAKGCIFPFTDDDVRPPANWIDGMCRPILRRAAHWVAGGLRAARQKALTLCCSANSWAARPRRAWVICMHEWDAARACTLWLRKFS